MAHAETRPVEVRLGPGPSAEHALTARPGVGLVSLQAIEYVASDDGVADLGALVPGLVGHVIGPGEELQYAVLPEWLDEPGAPHGFASDAIALDLRFADGARLSELDAVDQYGVALSPIAQHDGCVLQPDQWNLVRVRLDAMAGARVEGVELRFVRTLPPESVVTPAGWIDAVRITARPAPPSRPAERVRTRQGTMSSRVLSRGNSVPAVTLPHGFVSGIPVTRASDYEWPYSWHHDNREDNRPAIEAFATSHIASPWLGERGAFQIMPMRPSGPTLATPDARALGFDHASELDHPHRYRVELDGGITAELTSTEHTVLARFRYPRGTPDAVLVFDQIEGTGAIRLPDPDPSATRTSVRAYTDDALGDGQGTGRIRFPRAFLYADIDGGLLASGMLPEAPGEPRVRGTDRSRARGWVRVALDDHAAVTVRLATSFIGTEQARRNLELDDALRPFDEVAASSAAAWDAWLDRIEVDGATEEQRAQLATCLYRVGRFPRRAHENIASAARPEPRYASPWEADGEWTSDRTGSRVVRGELSTEHGFWDVYRTAWPLQVLLDPEEASRLLDGFVEHFRSGGWTSRWSAPGPVDSMTGTSVDTVLAQAVDAGIPVRTDPSDGDDRLDLWSAYDSALRNATVPSASPLVGRKGLSTSQFRGWVDTSIPEGLGWTIDGSLNDLAVASLAHSLLERTPPEHERREELETNHAYFTARAGWHALVFDRRIGFYQGRHADGTFRCSPAEYDPTVWGVDYTETNGWGTAFSAPHDGAGLATLHGGPDALAARLERLLATPERGGETVRGSYPTVIHEITEARNQRLGMLALSNQPAHHIPYMALFAGRPDLAQDVVRTAAERLFTGGDLGQGWPGDEDNGEMSAWWIFAAIGLYPLIPGRAGYVLTAPLFPRVRLRLGADAVLVIDAPLADRAHRYVQAVEIDGREWAGSYVPHSRLANGAVITIHLATTPQLWGTEDEARPPSLTRPGELPTVLRDVTARRRDLIAPRDASAAFDDDSSSGALFLESSESVTVQLDAPAAPEFLTLTPVVPGTYAWRLECRTDGQWVTVDERREDFRWDRQTRAFALRSPIAEAWRLTAITRVQVAQLELLVREPADPAGGHRAVRRVQTPEAPNSRPSR